MLTPVLLALSILGSVKTVDLAALDEAIERCERSQILPVFASEAQRRSGVMTLFVQEQEQITTARMEVTNKRRWLREGAAHSEAPEHSVAADDHELALRQLALDDRQRALDDQRRLEAMRQEAVDVKRGYFLSRCTSMERS